MSARPLLASLLLLLGCAQLGCAQAGSGPRAMNDSRVIDSAVDARVDANVFDSQTMDVGFMDSRVDLDAAADARADASTSDGGLDAGRDAGTDAGLDARADVGIDSGTVDSGTDVGVDAGPSDICSASPPSCAATCVNNISNQTNTCGSLFAGNMLDARGYSSVEATVTLCNASGWTFHLSTDSEEDGYGGTYSEAYFVNASFAAQRDYYSGEPSDDRLVGNQSIVNQSGCHDYRIVVSPNRVRVCGTMADYQNAYLFPSIDTLYFAYNGVLNGRTDRAGSGLTQVRYCLRR